MKTKRQMGENKQLEQQKMESASAPSGPPSTLSTPGTSGAMSLLDVEFPVQVNGGAGDLDIDDVFGNLGFGVVGDEEEESSSSASMSETDFSSTLSENEQEQESSCSTTGPASSDEELAYPLVYDVNSPLYYVPGHQSEWGFDSPPHSTATSSVPHSHPPYCHSCCHHSHGQPHYSQPSYMYPSHGYHYPHHQTPPPTHHFAFDKNQTGYGYHHHHHHHHPQHQVHQMNEYHTGIHGDQQFYLTDMEEIPTLAPYPQLYAMNSSQQPKLAKSNIKTSSQKRKAKSLPTATKAKQPRTATASYTTTKKKSVSVPSMVQVYSMGCTPTVNNNKQQGNTPTFTAKPKSPNGASLAGVNVVAPEASSKPIKSDLSSAKKLSTHMAKPTTNFDLTSIDTKHESRLENANKATGNPGIRKTIPTMTKRRNPSEVNNTVSSTINASMKAQTSPRKRSKLQSSKYRGVSRCSKDGRFQARIRVGATVKYLGRFRTEEEAAHTYDIAAHKYHAERAVLNFPLKNPPVPNPPSPEATSLPVVSSSSPPQKT